MAKGDQRASALATRVIPFIDLCHSIYDDDDASLIVCDPIGSWRYYVILFIDSHAFYCEGNPSEKVCWQTAMITSCSSSTSYIAQILRGAIPRRVDGVS